MSGFLKHLVQRSLAERSSIRPRPVSLFEPNPLVPAPDATSPMPFSARGRPSGNQEVHFERESTFAHAPVSRDPPPVVRPASLDVAQELTAAEPTPRPDPWANLRSTTLRGVLRTVRTPGPDSGNMTPVRPAEANVQNDGTVQATARAPSTSTMQPVAEEVPWFSTVESPRRAPPLGEVPNTPGRARARKDSPTQAVMEPEPVDSTMTPRARPFQLRGKSRVRPGWENMEIPAGGPLLTHPRRAPVESRPMTLHEPSDGTPTASPGPKGEVQALVSPASVRRHDLAVPVQATLTPHLPRPTVLEPAQPSVSKPAEPVVHVTIGRVEIRAVSTPPSPKRAAPSKPALSLSDYLQRRNGRRG